ncbi:unnamed protein product [Caretta caretta]
MVARGSRDPVPLGNRYFGFRSLMDYKSDNVALASSARNSPQGPVLTTMAVSKVEVLAFHCINTNFMPV